MDAIGDVVLASVLVGPDGREGLTPVDGTSTNRWYW
jgi:hypothetical protein